VFERVCCFSRVSSQVLTRLCTGVFEGFPSTTTTPYPSPVKGAHSQDPYPNGFASNLLSSFAPKTLSPTPKLSPVVSPLKRRREEEVDADIKLRLRRSEHASDLSTDDESDSDDDLDIITCYSDNDKAYDRPIRPLRKSSCGPRALSALSALNAGSFNAASGVGLLNVPPVKDIQVEDQIMTIIE
jgi:hypothetical protein